VAIQPDYFKPHAQPLLMDFEHNMSLSSILRDVASRWDIDKPDQYSFIYVDLKKGSKGNLGYITEENRQELKNGDFLRIALSPTHQAKATFDKINSGDPNLKAKGIEELATLSRDPTFAVAFISMNSGNGIQSLIAMVEKTQLTPNTDKENLANILGAFQELMEHGIVSWDIVGMNFVKKIINFLDHYAPSLTYRCMGILESIVLNSSVHCQIVIREVIPANLIGYIGKGSVDVTHYTLALINALMTKSQPTSVLQELALNQFSRAIHDHILQQAQVDRDIAHQLSIYQSFILNQVEGRMRTPFIPGDDQMEDLLKQLPHRAFPDDYRGKNQALDQHWKQLGFSNPNPRDEFHDTPPGILALDCMEYLARNKHDIYTRLLFAQMDNPCPFAQTSVALTKILCSFFRIGEQPAEIGYVTEFIPLLILTEDPFKEIFCVTIQLLFKTWREMRASVLDLEKVTTIVLKQITMVMQSQDTSTLTSSDILRGRLFEISYKKITESEEQSQLLDESVLKTRPVEELRKKITPEIWDLVQRERLNHLVQGANFPKIGGKRRDQTFYCRLSPNHKVLHFGDSSGQSSLPIESLDNKIQVSDMRLVTGNECPHADRQRKGTSWLFSVFYNSSEHLDFVVTTETVYNIWVDGLLVLLGKPMQSKAAQDDMETLLKMDLKLRLLDLEGVTIPNQPPSLPAEPTSFDFYYKLD
jgi:engulfment/cell motility protein 1